MKTLNKGHFETFEKMQEFFLKHQEYIEVVSILPDDNPHTIARHVMIYITNSRMN